MNNLNGGSNEVASQVHIREQQLKFSSIIWMIGSIRNDFDDPVNPYPSDLSGHDPVCSCLS